VRQLILRKSSESSKDEIQYCGYIGLFGGTVDTFGMTSEVTQHVKPEYIASKEKRDGLIHHITLLTKPEVSTVLKHIRTVGEHVTWKTKKSTEKNDLEYLLDFLSDQLEDDLTDLGLGMQSSNKNEAYFKVVQWPSAAALRTALGLPPKDLHVTVGFIFADIHDVKKDRSTLLDKSKRSGKDEE